MGLDLIGGQQHLVKVGNGKIGCLSLWALVYVFRWFSTFVSWLNLRFCSLFEIGTVLARSVVVVLGGSSCMVKITPNTPHLDHAKK